MESAFRTQAAARRLARPACRRRAEIEDGAILGVGADHEELPEPIVDRLSFYARRRIEVEIRFDLSSA
jgi:hypothetical protein